MGYGLSGTPLAIRIAAAAFLISRATAAEDYSLWAYGTDVSVNTSGSGAAMAGTIRGFPLLVRLSAGNFPFSQARGRGQDVRFSKMDGIPLAYEIERWDSAGARAEIWVKMDTVLGNTAGQTFRLLWGNPSAADSSDGAAVFTAAHGYVAAWHLNGFGPAPRPNAVAGGQPATPAQYDGNENRTGMIAGADSLDGGAPGDHLSLGAGYTEFTEGFSFSVWAYPTAVKKFAHVLDLGNGERLDNIILTRVDMTAGLGFHLWDGGIQSPMTAANQWVQNQWQHIVVTMSGRNVRIYKNGSLVLSETMAFPISGVRRNLNYLGRSHWAVDEYFQGKLDQPELSKSARSPDWIKLSYETQKSGQTTVTVKPPTLCQARFSAPADTVIDEGGRVALAAEVECASSFFWSAVSGPAPRILDPEAKVLDVGAPRVSGDTSIVYRLNAKFGDMTRTLDVRIRIDEAIPDPQFTLPPGMAWSGRDSLAVKPAISNLAAIRSSPDSVLHWAWSMTGPETDTAWLDDGLLLRGPASEGELKLKLCLDNAGTPTCQDGTVLISETVGLARTRRADPSLIGAGKTGFDAVGRKSAPAGKTPSRIPRFFAK